jgi:hypothetical protein
MYTLLNTRIPGLAAFLRRFRYGLRRSHPNHLLLVGMQAGFRGVTTIYQILLLGQTGRGWAEVYGGTPHGADFDAPAARQLIERFLEGLQRELGIKHLVWFIHRSRSGRLDFHLLFVIPDELRKPYKAILRQRVRAAARAAIEAVNEARLAAGRFTVGYLDVEGVVVYPQPKPARAGTPARVPVVTIAAPSTPATPRGPVEMAPPARVSAPPQTAAPDPTVTVAPAPSAPPSPPAPPPSPLERPERAAPPLRPPEKTAPAAIPVLERTRTREIDLADLAAKEARARDEARKKREREQAEAADRERARSQEYDHFRKHLRLWVQKAAEAESLTKEIHRFLTDNPGVGADDPVLTRLEEASHRFLADAKTRALMDAAITIRVGDRPELLTLKQQCQNADDQVRLASSELAETVAALTAVREHAIGFEKDRRERLGPERA